MLFLLEMKHENKVMDLKRRGKVWISDIPPHLKWILKIMKANEFGILTQYTEDREKICSHVLI